MFLYGDNIFQGMFFCYMLPTGGCHGLSHFIWALSGSGVGMIGFQHVMIASLGCEEESLIYTKRLSACVSAVTLNP
jgi:hypothetical protein